MGNSYWSLSKRGHVWRFYYRTDKTVVFEHAGHYRAWVEMRDADLGPDNARGWSLKAERYFAIRWKAKDWAYREYCKMRGIEFQSTHTKPNRVGQKPPLGPKFGAKGIEQLDAVGKEAW